jgi:hypothetical protein
MTSRIALCLCLSLAACARLAPPDGVFRCNPSGPACPDGYVCVATLDSCYRADHVPDAGELHTRVLEATNRELIDDGAAFDSVETVAWAAAARAATAYCTRRGYVGGHFTGDETETTKRLVCYGAGASLSRTDSALRAPGTPNDPGWARGWTSIDGTGWDTAAREAGFVCGELGLIGGQFNGNQAGDDMDVICFDQQSILTSITQDEETTLGFSPIDDLRLVLWADGARLADRFCSDPKRGYVSGRLDGNINALEMNLLGVVCTR